MSWYSNLIRKMRNKEITSVSVNELIEACDILNDGGNPLLRNNSYYHFVYMANALTGLMNNNATNLSAAMSKSKSFAKGDDVTLDDEQKAKLNTLLECAVTESNGSLTLKGCSKMNSLVDVINKAKEKAEKEKQEEEEKLKKEAEKMAEEAAKKADETNKADNGDESDEKLKAGNVSGKANDITAEEQEVNEQLGAVVNNVINGIMDVYSRIYQPLFLTPPRGVFYTDENGSGNIMAIGRSGDASDKENVRVHGIPSLAFFSDYIYGAIKKTCDYIREAPKTGDHGMFIKASWMHPDGTMDYNYVPHIQIRNCMGVYLDKDTNTLKRAKTWSEFSSKLKQDLKPTILALLKRTNYKDTSIVKKAVESIKELYTTIFLVNELDTEKVMRLTICSATGSVNGKVRGIAKNIITANPFSKSLDAYKVMDDSEQLGLRKILIVTDIDKYRGEINFAYKTLGKVVAAGGTIDLKHTIVGTDLSGNNVELNLNNNAYVSIGVVAGSRSGKGVLTMSLVAAMLAAKCPVIYLDYKPDMAGVFWDLDRKLGTRTLAIDGQTSKIDSLVPVRNYRAGYGANKEVYDEFNSHLNLLPYIKGVQLMNIIGAARVMGKIPAKEKMFFVLDEAQACSAAIVAAQKSIDTVVKKFKPKGKDAESEAYLYCKKLEAVYMTVGDSATTFLNTNAGKGNMSALILGQQPNASDWKGPFSNMMLKCAVKFLGNGTVGGSQYGLHDDIKGVEMIGTGYFGLSLGNTPTADNTTIIKTTMVLNDADFDAHTRKAGPFSGSLLKNIVNEEIKNDIIENDMIVSESNEIALSAGLQLGETNQLVGFPGLVKFMSSSTPDFSLNDALNAGYNVAEKVLNMLGIVGDGCPYDTVEGYLYSGRADSLFSAGQLLNAINNDMTIYSYLENGIDAGDGRIEENPALNNGDDDLIGFGAGFGTSAATNPANTTNNTSEVATNNVANSFGNISFDESSIKTKEDAEAVNEAIANSTEQRYEQRSAQLKRQIENDPWAMANSSAATDEMVDFQGEIEVEAFDADGDGIPDAEDDFFGPGTLSDQNISTTISNDMGDNESGHVGMDGVDLTEEQINLANSDFTQPVAQKSKEQHITTDKNGKVNMDAARLQKGTQVVKVNNSNFIPVNSAYMPPSKMDKVLNSERKYRKFVRMVADSFIDDIGRAVGGRLMVRTLLIQNSGMLVNNEKIVKSDMLQYLDNSMQEIVNFEDIFSEFSNLTMLMLDKAMYSVFLEQITPCITEKDMAEGISDPAYFVLKHRAKLNEIQVKDVGVFRKAELLEKERKENLKALQEKQAEYARQMVRNRMDSAKKAKKMKVQTRTNNTPSRAAKRRAALVSGGRGFGRGVWKLTKGIGRGLFKLFT